MNILLLSLVMLTGVNAVEAVAVRETLEAAKKQYAAASYEEALMTLATAEAATAGTRVEIEQYRALCLIALGRIPEAERAVAELVEADPKYLPSADIASPRVLSLVAEMRRKELPSATRRLLDAGREAFDAKDLPRAKAQFEMLLDLLDEPGADGVPDRDDLRVLAEGFVTLSEAMNKPRIDPEAQPGGEDAPALPEPPPVEQMIMLPAVAIQQEIPVWNPPDAVAAARSYKGSIRIRIGADGRVRSARIEEATHPAFDVRLQQAAEGWVYQPATRNGTPIDSEKIVVVQLNPRE